MSATIFSRGFLLQLIESAPFLIQIFSGGGKTLYQNSASSETRKISGIDGYLVAIHPDDRDFSFKNWERSLRDTSSVEQEVRFLGKDNVYRWYLEKIICIDNFRVGVLIDINESRVIEEQGLRLMNELCQNLHVPLSSSKTTVKFLQEGNESLASVMKDIELAESIIADVQRKILNLSFKKATQPTGL